jgi:hypothetical protein
LLLDRIRGFLTEAKFNDEFSHTIIHNTNVFEEKSKKKRRRMLSRVNKRRKELDSPSLKGEAGDKEKIICEMASLVLDEEETTSLNEKSEKDAQVEGSKAFQFRVYLEEIMGIERFREVYSVIRNVDMTEDSDNYEMYFERLKHIINRKDQKKYLPMVKALIEFEETNN